MGQGPLGRWEEQKGLGGGYRRDLNRGQREGWEQVGGQEDRNSKDSKDWKGKLGKSMQLGGMGGGVWDKEGSGQVDVEWNGGGRTGWGPL